MRFENFPNSIVDRLMEEDLRGGQLYIFRLVQPLSLFTSMNGTRDATETVGV